MSRWFAPARHLLIEADAAPEPDAIELTDEQWDEMQAVRARKLPAVTALRGNAASHSTSGRASRVTVYVVAPVGGNANGRPQIEGVPVCATPGGAPLSFENPPSLTITTHAGNNDLIIVEEFDA